MNKWKVRYLELRSKQLDHVQAEPIIFRTVSVDFEARTISFDGNKVKVEHRAIDFPILSTDKVLLNRTTGEFIP